MLIRHTGTPLSNQQQSRPCKTTLLQKNVIILPAKILNKLRSEIRNQDNCVEFKKSLFICLNDMNSIIFDISSKIYNLIVFFYKTQCSIYILLLCAIIANLRLIGFRECTNYCISTSLQEVDNNYSQCFIVCHKGINILTIS